MKSNQTSDQRKTEETHRQHSKAGEQGDSEQQAAGGEQGSTGEQRSLTERIPTKERSPLIAKELVAEENAEEKSATTSNRAAEKKAITEKMNSKAKSNAGKKNKWYRWSHHRFNHEADACSAMSDWFRTGLGRYVLRLERLSVARSISRFFGYHQLEMLLREDIAVGEKSLLGHRIIAVPYLEEDSGTGSLSPKAMPSEQFSGSEGLVVCHSDELPFANDSINLIILHHTLDVTAHPHQTLREACRVLRSGGHIVIVGFNPYSFWGIRRFFSRFSRQPTAPWSTRFLSSLRLEDWLNLLQFEPTQIKHQFFMPPLGRLQWLKRFALLEKLGMRLRLPLGAFYTIQAQKQVPGSISLKPKWISQPVSRAATVHQFSPCKRDHSYQQLNQYKQNEDNQES